MAAHAQSSSTSSTSMTRITRRYWRRTDTPRPWWPWGWLALIGLALLFLFGALIIAPAIQAEVKNGVSQNLAGAGVAISEISADGQRVTARVGAAGPDKHLLEAVAASTKCATWAGELTCPSTVTLQRELAKAAPAIATMRPHPFEVVRDADSVILRGEVPSAAERARIVSLAGGHFDQVADQMRVSNESAGANYAPAAERAIAVVSRLASGSASWSGEQLSVSGSARSGDVAAARAEFDAAQGPGMLGSFDVQAIAETMDVRRACNNAFQDVLSNATIRFQTSSATIDAGNETLLQRLAKLANDCPGNLTIEGHTDSSGDAGMNEALSQARAAAVRDALTGLGIAAGRLKAVGYGEAQPIADNETAAGRATNRRIAISVD